MQKNGSSYGWYVFKEIIASLFSFYTFAGIFTGLCEEIGWRGFLYPALDRHFGRTKAVLYGGLIHGAWHFPLMLLTGYEYGTDYIGAPVMGLLAFCVFTVSTGIISYHLYEKSYSIWLPALFHGAVNTVFNPYMFGGWEHPERSIFSPVDIGLIAVIPMAVFAAHLLYPDNQQEQFE